MKINPATTNSIHDRIDRALEKEKRWIYLLFLLAFMLKLVFVLQSRNSLQIKVPILDARYYDAMAQSISGGKLISSEAFFMGPLYPYIMGIVYGIFGRSFMVMRLIQISAGAFTVVLTYLVGAKLFRPSTAMLGALLLAFYGTITFYEGQMLMMWLGTFLNSLLLYVLICGPWKSGVLSLLQRHYSLKYILAGLLLGLSSIARGSILIVVPVILAWLFMNRREKSFNCAAAFVGSIMLVILPVTVHNLIASDDFVFITYNGGLNFYIGNSSDATGVYSRPKELDSNDDVTTRQYLEKKLGRDLKPSRISGYWMNKSISFIKENPGKELSLIFRKVTLFLNGYEWPQIESYDLSKEKFGIFKVLFVNFWLLISLGIVGMIYAFRRWRHYFLLHWFLIAYSASIILFFVTDRYRIQTAPLLSLFAAYAVAKIYSQISRRSLMALLSFAMLFVLMVFTRPGLFATDMQRLRSEEHIHRAWRWQTVGNTEIALDEIDAAIQLDRHNPEPYIQRGFINREAGKYSDAARDYKYALEINPSMPSVHYSLAQVFEKTKSYSLAVKEYSAAIEQDSLMIEAYNNLGILYRQMKEYGMAIRYFRQAILIDPDYIKAYNNMGASFAEQGDPDTAIQIFREAIARDPDYPNSYKNLAMAYIEKNRFQEAKVSLEKYLGLVPGDAFATRMMHDLNRVLNQGSGP